MSEKLITGISYMFAMKGKCYDQVLRDLNLDELSFKQLKYIKMLNSEEWVTVSQIAESFELSKPTVTEMIKKFVRTGIVTKETCPHDGRVHYIKLTDKGMAIATLENKTIAYLEKRISEKLNDQDIEDLKRILCKLR